MYWGPATCLVQCQSVRITQGSALIKLTVKQKRRALSNHCTKNSGVSATDLKSQITLKLLRTRHCHGRPLWGSRHLPQACRQAKVCNKCARAPPQATPVSLRPPPSFRGSRPAAAANRRLCASRLPLPAAACSTGSVTPAAATSGALKQWLTGVGV